LGSRGGRGGPCSVRCWRCYKRCSNGPAREMWPKPRALVSAPGHEVRPPAGLRLAQWRLSCTEELMARVRLLAGLPSVPDERRVVEPALEEFERLCPAIAPDLLTEVRDAAKRAVRSGCIRYAQELERAYQLQLEGEGDRR
jgi:hypothetical protein